MFAQSNGSRPRASMLTLPLSVSMTTQLGKKTGKGLHADVATVIAHDTLVWQADKSAVKDYDE